MNPQPADLLLGEKYMFQKEEEKCCEKWLLRSACNAQGQHTHGPTEKVSLSINTYIMASLGSMDLEYEMHCWL